MGNAIINDYNCYSYALNNPLKYTDPDGEIIAFTENGYDFWKYISPVAVKVDVGLGDHTGIGIRTSVGKPQALPLSTRIEGGAGYWWKNGEIPQGWQFTYGYEIGITPFLIIGNTNYVTPGSPEFNQQTGHALYGVPGVNIKYENDWLFGIPLTGDNGDRYRTGAAKVQAGPLSVGINIFTGDPGLDEKDREVFIDPVTGKKTYETKIHGDDPDKYRAGIGYIGIGSFRIGNNKESRRDKIQNQLIHDKVSHSPNFKVDEDRPDKSYFQFGSGGGYLW